MASSHVRRGRGRGGSCRPTASWGGLLPRSARGKEGNLPGSCRAAAGKGRAPQRAPIRAAEIMKIRKRSRRQTELNPAWPALPPAPRDTPLPPGAQSQTRRLPREVAGTQTLPVAGHGACGGSCRPRQPRGMPGPVGQRAADPCRALPCSRTQGGSVRVLTGVKRHSSLGKLTRANRTLGCAGLQLTDYRGILFASCFRFRIKGRKVGEGPCEPRSLVLKGRYTTSDS